jgi:hypothetical protein
LNPTLGGIWCWRSGSRLGLIAMFQAYFDDSGTNADSEIAVAACYISTNRGWDEFTAEWDEARWQEGFEAFHMAEFVAPREHNHQPFCKWDDTKKDHVYGRLAKIINDNKRIGIASAVPKRAYDSVPERIRNYHGREHYTFAVRMCLLRIAAWRESSGISLPMQYVFDWEMGRKRKEIENIWNNMHESWEKRFGIEPEGYSFQRRHQFKPLQSADILAWQMNNHMRKIFPVGHDSLDVLHPGFQVLREDQEMDLGFFTEEQIKLWVRKIDEDESTGGPYRRGWPRNA